MRQTDISPLSVSDDLRQHS